MPHNHFYMGAINKKTRDYIFPIHAHKNCKYCCPECNDDVIFRNGKIKIPHFAHNKKSNCSYYTTPCESEIHKGGKKLLKKLFEIKHSILIYRRCKCCKEVEKIFNILTHEYTDQISCHEEYSFIIDDKKKYADVALLNGINIDFIFEIFNTHKTSEERQNKYKWCEIDASILLNETMNKTNINENGEIEIECVRDIKCKKCIICSIVNKNHRHNLNIIKYFFNKIRRVWWDFKLKLEQERIKKRYEYLSIVRRYWTELKNMWLNWVKKRQIELEKTIMKKKLMKSKNIYYNTDKKEQDYQDKIKRLRGY
tara:strand:- start:929 stop:1858 length:930 start_codon:yes stop_codon:yes gene_type:complete